MTEYFCYCWRDAIDDPPTDPKWWGFLREKSTGRMYLGSVLPAGSKAGMEWMDVTEQKAIPREQVQAAAKWIASNQEMARGNDEYTALGTAIDIIEEYTGITPTEVTP